MDGQNRTANITKPKADRRRPAKLRAADRRRSARGGHATLRAGSAQLRPMHFLRDPFSEVGDCTGMKIVGFGNLERGDDAAGILVVQRLREWGIDACVATSAFDAWEAADDVVLVDAMSTGREVGGIVVWEGSEFPELAQF